MFEIGFKVLCRLEDVDSDEGYDNNSKGFKEI